MKILGIVTLFNPPATVGDNLRSYARYLDGLFLWDNTPGEGAVIALPKDVEEKIVKIRRGANVGIGEALNAAISMVQEEGYTHLLTMDQASRFEEECFDD